MRESHLPLLQCIECGGGLEVSHFHPVRNERGEIWNGVLTCQGCGVLFPVVRGVGLFFPPGLLFSHLNDFERQVVSELGINEAAPKPFSEADERVVRTARNWSYQWVDVSPWKESDFEGKGLAGWEAFRAFIPFEPSEYRGRRVVIWCGGNGREAYHVAKHGPGLLVVNEIGDGIHRIRDLLPPASELLLIKGDMLSNPIRPGTMDISICDHALQHISDHRAAFRRMVEALLPGGKAAICVYSHENNFLMTHLVEPAKGLLHRFPLKVLKMLGFPPALVILVLIHFFYLPLSRLKKPWLSRSIPLFEHMVFWSNSSLRFIWTSCFDLLHAPISYHFRRAEVESLARENDLTIQVLSNTNGTLWSMVCRKEPVAGMPGKTPQG